MNGDISYSIEIPDSSENASELSYEKIMEIYTPIFKNGEIIGVIEVYENYEKLESYINTITNKIYLIIISCGGALYFLQFFIFYNVYRRLRRSNHKLSKSKEVTLFALATLAETRDNETGQHIQRTAEYVRIIAEKLSETPDFSSYLTRKYINDLVISAPLHDIGKVGIRDSILLKKGKLTKEEFEEMKKHCIIGTMSPT
ncbi:MAG: HD domain-containing protein [Clostridiales bacterium]|nr:HD domain-containing protein [Clostridiales bacterium]